MYIRAFFSTLRWKSCPSPTMLPFWTEVTDQSGTVKFYDAQCGIPLFEAPKGRTYAEFKRESERHGWPSFRDEEIIKENIKVLDGGEVVSKCNTKAGPKVPKLFDQKGLGTWATTCQTLPATATASTCSASRVIRSNLRGCRQRLSRAAPRVSALPDTDLTDRTDQGMVAKQLKGSRPDIERMSAVERRVCYFHGPCRSLLFALPSRGCFCSRSAGHRLRWHTRRCAEELRIEVLALRAACARSRASVQLLRHLSLPAAVGRAPNASLLRGFWQVCYSFLIAPLMAPTSSLVDVRTQHAAGRAHFTDHRPDFQMRRCMRSSLTCMVGHWEVVGKLQSVPWQWVCSVELSLAGFLAPTACLYPVQSIAIYALTWVFLLHPGSTQTPRLLRLCQDCFDEIEHIVNQERAVAGVEWRARNPNTAPHDKNPYRGRLNFCLC
eukprot:s1499_g4.t1